MAAEAASCHSDFRAAKAIERVREKEREKKNNAPAEIDSLDKPLSGTSQAVRRMDFFPSSEKLGFDLWHGKAPNPVWGLKQEESLFSPSKSPGSKRTNQAA